MLFLRSMQVLLVVALNAGSGAEFPADLVAFEPYSGNPVFEGAGAGHWDEAIRERGWILREGEVYHMWYTGYTPPESNTKKLGYATSRDGFHWERYAGNPIHGEHWVEDMMVVKHGDTYYMFAEGEGDHAELLTSTDRIHWQWEGTLDMRMANGQPLTPGPFGTPFAMFENGTWYLFYERDDDAIWVATSKDLKVWTNVQDEPVIRRGPEPYDRTMIALNQIVKRDGRYYGYYHAICPENGPNRWSMCVATSSDLIHWEKYAGNPIIAPDHSSGILVPDDRGFRMYCMHPAVWVYFPKGAQNPPNQAEPAPAAK